MGNYLHTTVAHPEYTRKFTLGEVRRVPVTLSGEARALLDRSTHQGRLLPQALSEFYGEMDGVYSIEMEVQQVNERPHLVVLLTHTSHDGLCHAITLDDIQDFHGGFRAAHTAEEMRHLSQAHIERRNALRKEEEGRV